MSNRLVHTTVADRALACAVLMRAIDDVLNGPMEYCGDLEIAEARSFLTEPGGEWRVSRRLWCDQAGIDPDAFELRVAELLRAA